MRCNGFSRLATVLAFATGSLVATGASAQADAPTRITIEAETLPPITVNDLCSFPVEVTGTHTGGFILDFTDASGAGRQNAHVTESDVFSANGNTLEGLPYTFQFHLTVDEEGNETHATSTGVAVLVPLPGGQTFRAAGQVNFLTATTDFVAVPTHGGSRNLDAFCAALAE